LDAPKMTAMMMEEYRYAKRESFLVARLVSFIRATPIKLLGTHRDVP
jgi:hypothetical protein